MTAERIYADEVMASDLILWAGYVAEVVEVRTPPEVTSGARAGRYLMLDAFGEDSLRRCQYYDDEVVTLHARPAHIASSEAPRD